MSRIKLSVAEKGIRCEPIDYLGGKFQAYLASTKSAGLWYSKADNCQVGRRDALPAAIERLSDGGFNVELDPSAQELLNAQVDKEEAQRTAGEEVLKRAEERMAASGCSLYPYQRIGVTWLAGRAKGLIADVHG